MNVVVAVHGVGPTELGSLTETLRKEFHKKAIEAKVSEYHWADLSPASGTGDPISLRYAWELLFNSVSSSFIEVRSIGWKQLWASNRWTVIAAEIARLVMLSPLFLVPILLPLIVLLGYIASWSDETVGLVIVNYWRATLRLVLVGVYLAAGSLVIDCVTALFTRSPEQAVASIRRNLLHILGPVISAAVLPFAIPWNKNKISIIFLVIAFPLFMLVLAGSLHYLESVYHVPGQTQYDPLEFWEFLPDFAQFFTTAITTVFVLALIGFALVPWFVKVTLDVVRLTGDPEHRRRVLNRLHNVINRHLETLGDEDTLYLLGHSLGSVIILDYLLNVDRSPSRCRVVLVTGGSPIRRLFGNFFPNQFFPNCPRDSACLLIEKYRDFRWINVFRPWDQIGASMRFDDPGLGTDICTKQWGKFLTAHLGYWSDQTVLNKVLPVLHETIPKPKYARCPDSHFIPHRPYTCRIMERTCVSLKSLLGTLVPVVITLSIVTGLCLAIYSIRTCFHEHHQLTQTGISVDGIVSHIRVMDGVGEKTSSHKEIRAQFTTLDGTLITEKLWIQEMGSFLFLDRSYFMNIAGIIKEIDDSDKKIRESLPRPLGNPDFIWSSAPNIKVRYLPESPTVFDFPDHAVNPPTAKSIVRIPLAIAFHMFLAAQICVIYLLISAISLSALASLFGTTIDSEQEQ